MKHFASTLGLTFLLILTAVTLAPLPIVAQTVSAVSQDVSIVAPGNTTVRPDVQVLIMRDPWSRQMMSLTYPGLVPKAQAQGDVIQISKAANVAATDVSITNDALPLNGAKPIPMTGAVFEAPGVMPENETTFRLEPLIIALKGYKNLAITYIMPPGFVFNGLRSFSNRNVQIALDRRDSTYTYKVHVSDPNFDKLNLPLMQPTPDQMRYADTSERRQSIFRVLGLVLVSALAATVGYAVYALLSRPQ